MIIRGREKAGMGEKDDRPPEPSVEHDGDRRPSDPSAGGLI